MAEFHADDKFGHGRPVFLPIGDPRRMDLFQYNKGEGSAYINDFLQRSRSHTASQIPHEIAELILNHLGITKFENKEFVRINGNDELEGMREEPLFTFLYLHDYTYWIYNLR